MLSLLCSILRMLGGWRVYQKMGCKGWECLVPGFCNYVKFKILYGDGWEFLWLFIPIYSTYLSIKVAIDLAHAFDKGADFGVGLFFFPFVFYPILGFGSAVFIDPLSD